MGRGGLSHQSGHLRLHDFDHQSMRDGLAKWKLHGIRLCSVGFKHSFEGVGSAIDGIEAYVLLPEGKIDDCGVAISKGGHIVPNGFHEARGGAPDCDTQGLGPFPHIFGQVADIVIYGQVLRHVAASLVHVPVFTKGSVLSFPALRPYGRFSVQSA